MRSKPATLCEAGRLGHLGGNGRAGGAAVRAAAQAAIVGRREQHQPVLQQRARLPRAHLLGRPLSHSGHERITSQARCRLVLKKHHLGLSELELIWRTTGCCSEPVAQVSACIPSAHTTRGMDGWGPMDGAHSSLVREHDKDGVCVRAFIQVVRRARDRQRNGQDAQPPLQDLPAAVTVRFQSKSRAEAQWQTSLLNSIKLGVGLHGHTRPGT